MIKHTLCKNLFRHTLRAMPFVLLATLAGCEGIGAALYQTNGPAAIKAEYVPAPQEPMLVLVEDFSGGPVQSADTSKVLVTLMSELKDHKVAPLIDADVLEKLRDSTANDDFSQLTVTQIGHACGAKQVLYVHMLAANIIKANGAQTISGRAQARVQIIDVATGQTRWPADTDGSLQTVETPVIDGTPPGTEAAVHSDMAQKMGVHIGNLFHDWKPQFENQEKVETTGMADGLGH